MKQMSLFTKPNQGRFILFLIGLLGLLGLSGLLGACFRVEVAKPEGFAEVLQKNHYKAVSPEGVVFKVRWVENYPPKDLEFWSRALRKHLAEEGYQFVREENFEASSTAGTLFEWGAPYGNEDYVYLTAILVKGEKIVIAEAAGEFTLYSRYRQALVDSLHSLSLR